MPREESSRHLGGLFVLNGVGLGWFALIVTNTHCFGFSGNCIRWPSINRHTRTCINNTTHRNKPSTATTNSCDSPGEAISL
mmetsp:Transcript_117204/g.239792  ORF Transcript_117204/g.239792 Transcript_117204/m.239792 type:complete len:81 (-) Transcript_117204:2270-2512(-)